MNVRLTNEQYDILKWVISVVIPAAIAMLGTIMMAINYTYTDIFLTIAGSIELFLGTIFMVSNKNYKEDNR